MVTKEIEIEKKKTFSQKIVSSFIRTEKNIAFQKKKKNDNSTDFQKFLRL